MKLPKQYRTRVFVLLTLTLTMLLSSKTYSQKSYYRLFFMGSHPQKENKIPPTPGMVNINNFADSVLKISPIPWLKVNNPDKMDEILMYVRRSGGRIRVFQPLIDKGNYMILCSRNVENPCMCRNDASLYLYLPEQNTLKLVEKAFTFSLKRNLISRLNKYANFKILPHDFENMCNVLETISNGPQGDAYSRYIGNSRYILTH